MSVAMSYAKALYEAAVDKKTAAAELQKLENQLDTVSQLFSSNKQLRTALLAPSVTAKEKAAVIAEVSKRAALSPLLSQFLAVVARKDRIALLTEISSAFKTVYLGTHGGVL